MYLESALKELSRHSVDIGRQPDWLTITEQQINAARHIITSNFLNSEFPFETPSYRGIGYPFNLGKIENKSTIINSLAYEQALGPREFWYMRGCKLPNDYEYLQGVCDQYDTAVRTIYGPNKYLWHFFPDTRVVFPGGVHRSTLDSDDLNSHEPHHVDNNLDYKDGVARMLKEIQEGGQQLKIKDIPFKIGNIDIIALGIPVTFISIFSTPEDKRSFTEFKNAAFEFGNLDIVHFVAEPHRSPTIPIRSKRFFLQGVARPIK